MQVFFKALSWKRFVGKAERLKKTRMGNPERLKNKLAWGRGPGHGPHASFLAVPDRF